jgi:murein L,D-transpeptidase YafK
MNFKTFKQYKTRIFKKAEKKTILFNNINIIPYPNHKNTYEVTFKELYASKSFKFTGNKTLIVELKEDNKMQIITEK